MKMIVKIKKVLVFVFVREWKNEGRVKDPGADGGHPQKLLDGMAECQNESTFPQSSTENKYHPIFASYFLN